MPRFETYESFEASFPRVGQELVGTANSDWNGTLESQPPPSGSQLTTVNGSTLPDDTLRLHDSSVRAPLRDAYAHRGDPEYFTADRLKDIRAALGTTFHESVHLASDSPTTRREAFESTHGRQGFSAIEEGVTELYTRDHLDEYIDSLGFEDIAPGVADVRSPDRYVGQVPAAEALSNDIARATGRDPDEVVTDLASVNRADKFTVAAHLLYEGIADKSPEATAEPERTKAEMSAAIQEEFETIDHLDIDYGRGRMPPDVTYKSEKTGHQAFKALHAPSAETLQGEPPARTMSRARQPGTDRQSPQAGRD